MAAHPDETVVGVAPPAIQRDLHPSPAGLQAALLAAGTRPALDTALR